eukprot:1142326-Pelagomonas_calceolata.AAC.1
MYSANARTTAWFIKSLRRGALLEGAELNRVPIAFVASSKLAPISLMPLGFHAKTGIEPNGTPKYVVRPHDSTGSMNSLWGQIVQTSPIMDNLLTKNTLKVIHVKFGSGAYSSKLLSMRYFIQGCQNLASQTARAKLPGQCPSYQQDAGLLALFGSGGHCLYWVALFSEFQDLMIHLNQ